MEKGGNEMFVTILESMANEWLVKNCARRIVLLTLTTDTRGLSATAELLVESYRRPNQHVMQRLTVSEIIAFLEAKHFGFWAPMG